MVALATPTRPTEDHLSAAEEELVARLADAAYRAVLHEGLRRPFVDVQLDLWRQVRAAYRAEKIRAAAGAA